MSGYNYYTREVDRIAVRPDEARRAAEAAINELGLVKVMERYRAACRQYSDQATDDNRYALQRIGEEIADTLDGAVRYGERWCNHEPVAVVDGVCECGTVVTS